MNFKRVMGASALSAGVGLAGLFGVGLGTAAANPGQPCGGAPGQQCGPAQPGGNWQGRGVDQGRQDHKPFNWHGQQVTPMPAGNGAGWGFWFLGQWIPL